MSGAAPKKKLTSLWLIIALTTAPVIASYGLYYFWPPESTVNYGELIEPRPLPDPALSLAGGGPFRLSQLRGKWVLAIVDSGRCDAGCERKLLYLRQLRLTQGREKERVERVWILSDDESPRAGAIEPYAGTWRVRAAGTGLPDAFPAPRSAADHIYVIDPLGNLMMRFPRDPDPRRLIKDLARLLKASRVG